ncbi:hypothetical protein WPG_1028 [Winogradskyella sp. PG-2]|nr:hypothetical protein WPG_1028 [Winogradskyella sp. PG-2]
MYVLGITFSKLLLPVIKTEKNSMLNASDFIVLLLITNT